MVSSCFELALLQKTNPLNKFEICFFKFMNQHYSLLKALCHSPFCLDRKFSIHAPAQQQCISGIWTNLTWLQ